MNAPHDLPDLARRLGLTREPLPEWIAPMLAKPGELPADDDGWAYEIKWDGWRGLGIKHGDKTRLLSRQGKSLDADFPQVVAALGNAAEDFLTKALVSPEGILMTPRRTGTDGFFVTLLRKTS